MTIRFAICIAFLAVAAVAVPLTSIEKDYDGSNTNIGPEYEDNNPEGSAMSGNSASAAEDTSSENGQLPITIDVLDVTTEAVKNLTDSTSKLQSQLLDDDLYDSISTEINGLKAFINGLEQGIKRPVKEALVKLALAEVSNAKNKRILKASAADVSDRVDSINLYVDILDDNDVTSDAEAMKQVVQLVVEGVTDLQKKVYEQMDDAKKAYRDEQKSVAKGNTKLDEFVINLEALTKLGPSGYRSALFVMVKSGCNDGLVGGDVGLAICYGIVSNNMESKIAKFEAEVKELVANCKRVSEQTFKSLTTWKVHLIDIKDELDLIYRIQPTKNGEPFKDSIDTVKEAMTEEETNGSIASNILKNKEAFKIVAKVSKNKIAVALNALQDGIKTNYITLTR